MRMSKYSPESGWILPNPCSVDFIECEGDCEDCPNKNYWDEQKCPYCNAMLQMWRHEWANELRTEEDYEAAMVNNPGLTREHAIYHIPESY